MTSTKEVAVTILKVTMILDWGKNSRMVPGTQEASKIAAIIVAVIIANNFYFKPRGSASYESFIHLFNTKLNIFYVSVIELITRNTKNEHDLFPHEDGELLMT